MPQFIRLLGVAEEATPDSYLATIEADMDDNGTTEIVPYVTYPNDNFGIAPEVKEAITDWINSRKPVTPYVPPTPEELRKFMQPLTRRCLLLALFSIGITEGQIDAALGNDPEGMIEWKYASTFDRMHPLILSVAASFGLPDDQVDALWKWAYAL